MNPLPLESASGTTFPLEAEWNVVTMRQVRCSVHAVLSPTLPHVHGVNCNHDHALPVPPEQPENEKVLALFRFGVLTDHGRRKIGSRMMVEGREEIFKAVNVVEGLLYFESGKQISVAQ